MADGYARASNSPGVILAGQNGPGATNLVTGIAQAKAAFSPVVSIAGSFSTKDKMEDAKKLAGEQMVNFMRWVCHWRGLGNHMDPDEELPKTKGKLDLLNYDFLHKRNMLFGTPDYVVEKIKELKLELNLQNLQVWSNMPGVKHEDAMRSIKLFNDEVIPKINLAKTMVKQAS